jgi:hypothetical protein
LRWVTEGNALDCLAQRTQQLENAGVDVFELAGVYNYGVSKIKILTQSGCQFLRVTDGYLAFQNQYLPAIFAIDRICHGVLLSWVG